MKINCHHLFYINAKSSYFDTFLIIKLDIGLNPTAKNAFFLKLLNLLKRYVWLINTLV